MNYYIFKGFHFSFPFIPRFYYKRKVFKWEVVFDNSCRYNIGKEDQADWNKLVGVSNHIFPRKYSVRFVWRWYNDELQLGVYHEINKKPASYVIYTPKKNEPVKLELYIGHNFVTAKANGKWKYNYPFVSKKLRFRLNPYFGGNNPSPHLIKIKLKWLL
jgi:hypothetical protein